MNYEQTRKKYSHLAQVSGVDQAITALHREIGALEGKMYDGGFDVKRLEYVEKLRVLARNLYSEALRSN